MKEERNKNGWNYRVIKMADKRLGKLPQTYSYGIYEVYYTNDVPTSWSENPIWAIGETWNELYEDHQSMFRAFTQPTLELRGKKLISIGRFK